MTQQCEFYEVIEFLLKLFIHFAFLKQPEVPSAHKIYRDRTTTTAGVVSPCNATTVTISYDSTSGPFKNGVATVSAL